MLDYFFCEECQTYHQPNRVVNGQILSACQCEVKIQQDNQNKKLHQLPQNIVYNHPPPQSPPTLSYSTKREISTNNREIKISRYHEQNGFHQRVTKLQQMPFFNVLYKKSPEQIHKETQMSQVKASETSIRKSQSSSVLVKAQPYLKSIPIKQQRYSKQKNSQYYSNNMFVQKPVPVLKAGPPLRQFSEIKNSKSEQEYVKYSEYDSVMHERRKGFNVQGQSQQICCDHECFYF